MTHLFVLPSIHPPYTDLCVAGLAPELRETLLVVDNAAGPNRGVAGSWNVGAEIVIRDELDWLISLSGATRSGPEAGRDFIACLDRNAGAWVVEADAPVGWHMIGWSRDLLNTVGLFDENFWPAYGEDADMSRRIHTLVAEGAGGAWACEPVDAWIAMQGHGARLAGIDCDMTRSWAYYETKWGGAPGGETFTRPFDGDDMEFWPRPPDTRAVQHDGWPS